MVPKANIHRFFRHMKCKP